MPFIINHNRPVGDIPTDPLVLSPGPTNVEYPEFRLYNLRQTQDSAVIIQRPLNDSRIRKWSWVGYRYSVPNYQTQFDYLELLEARQLDADGYSPIVGIWENESEEGHFSNLTSGTTPDLVGYTNLDWTDVKIVQVHRTTRKGGGVVVYDDSWIEFVIVDSAWEEF